MYKAPDRIQLPGSESILSLPESAQSSCPSSPSSLSTGAGLDSEGDFARLADNLALKADLNVSHLSDSMFLYHYFIIFFRGDFMDSSIHFSLPNLRELNRVLLVLNRHLK